jgi:hypothetical protein
MIWQIGIPFFSRTFSGLMFQISRRMGEPWKARSSSFSPKPGWMVGAVT